MPTYFYYIINQIDNDNEIGLSSSDIVTLNLVCILIIIPFKSSTTKNPDS